MRLTHDQMVEMKQEESERYIRSHKKEKNQMRVMIESLQRQQSENQNWRIERLDIIKRIDSLNIENEALKSKIDLMMPVDEVNADDDSKYSQINQ